MKTKKKVLIFIRITASTILLFAVISCGVNRNLSNNEFQISAGQTKQQVLNILGNPGNSQFNGKDEAWQYCSTGLTSDHYVVIWFYDGLVTGKSSYEGYTAVGNCNQCFKTVNWQNAPDRTIELRER